MGYRLACLDPSSTLLPTFDHDRGPSVARRDRVSHGELVWPQRRNVQLGRAQRVTMEQNRRHLVNLAKLRRVNMIEESQEPETRRSRSSATSAARRQPGDSM